MMQRLLLITGVAAAGWAASAQSMPRLAATLPVVGPLSVTWRAAALFATVLAVWLGSRELGQRGGLGAALPALLVAGLFQTGPVLPASLPGWAPLAGLLTLLPAALYVTSAPRGAACLRSALTPIVVYGAALLYCAGVFAARWRALFTCPLIGAGCALLALALWRDGQESAPPRTQLVAAALTGLVVAEAAWAMLFWPAPALVGGVALAALFYMVSGVLASAGQERPSRARTLEYVLVGAAALAMVVLSVLYAS